MYQRILVPVDGSPTSSRGLAEAVKLAVDQRARLLLLHVMSEAYINAVLLGGLYNGDLLERLHTEGQTILDEARAKALAAGLEAETQFLEHASTQVGEGIVAEAVRWRADLIVMGTHGRRGVSRAIMGSDAEYVLRHTPVPVLLLRA
jgi:nucleotide-binding universal stress UspA family protein